MKFEVIFDFTIGDEVLMHRTDMVGTVESLKYENGADRYLIVFWLRGDRKEIWIRGDELKATKQV